jgi:lycopene cyclase domain-containing protein
MEKYYYLLIDFFTILFPFLLSFDKKVAFYKSWLQIFKGLLFGGIIFLIWDHFFTVQHIWSFNPAYITGIHIASLPIEEVLFFILIPYACLFIWHCIEAYFPQTIGLSFAKYFWMFILLFSILAIFLFYDRTYTLVTFALLSSISLYFIIRPKAWHSSFIIGYLISIIPFFIVNGLLTSIPIVLYNDMENVGFRWGTIPFEDSFYMLALLMINAAVSRRGGLSN